MPFSRFGLLTLLCCVGMNATARPEAAASPWMVPVVSVETGVLWQAGRLTPLSYRLVPTQVSWRWGAFMRREFSGGSTLVVRHRLTAIATWIQSGPESRYLGFAGSPSIEWWSRRGTWALYGGVGGGAGLIDSRGVRGGQGQDFTLNWFARGGIEIVLSEGSRVTAGPMFQHMSNGGRTDPNPGVDAVGFMIGYGWSY